MPWFRFFPTALALCLAATAAASAPPSPAAGTVERTLVVFGDSLTAGYGLENPADAFPGVLQRRIDGAGLRWRVVGAGLSGDTTAGGLRRADWVLRQRVDVFLLALGGNDGLRGIDPAETRRNLLAILAKVRARWPGARLVVAGMQMPPSMGSEYTARFRAVFPGVATEAGAALVPFLLHDVGAVPALNLPDGIHPNPAGHQRVADNVWPALAPLLAAPLQPPPPPVP